jgi:hypothetical protein
MRTRVQQGLPQLQAQIPSVIVLQLDEPMQWFSGGAAAGNGVPVHFTCSSELDATARSASERS